METIESNAGRFSVITSRETQEQKKVKITSGLKPEIISEASTKWQLLLDMIVKIIDVPAGLIMRLHEETIEVFLASNSPGNPYKQGEKSELHYGLYCETVIATQKKLLVPNATNNPLWSVSNPDLELNMVSYLGYPVNWPDGEVFGTLCVLDNKENHYSANFEELFLNIKQSIESELKLLVMDQVLKESNARLEQLIGIKDKFFSIIAHDLKSPFNSIVGFSDLLLGKAKQNDHEKTEEYARIILESSEKAMNLLENLMLWSYSQTGRLEYAPMLFDLVSLIGEVLALHAAQATGKSIKLMGELPSKYLLFADKAMINTVLRNLVSNAIKFTKPGGQICVAIAPKENELEVSVSDTGVGIDKENIGKLFEIGESYSTKGTRNEKGTGLGLILCKEFVNKHGGQIWAESDKRFGSTFSFTIPLVK